MACLAAGAEFLEPLSVDAIKIDWGKKHGGETALHNQIGYGLSRIREKDAGAITPQQMTQFIFTKTQAPKMPA